MTHQQLITTPDIDLMQLAESNPSDEILDELAGRGTATVIEWLRSRGYCERSTDCEIAAAQRQHGTIPFAERITFFLP